MGLEEITQRTKIGEGRLGIVFHSKDKDGNDIATKVFTGENLLIKLANYFFTGAPNPYVWNEDAVQSSHYRREILQELVPCWIDSNVRVAGSLGAQWNDKFQVYELQTEFIDGRHAALHHTFSEQREWELSNLVNDIMKPLQKKLIESGFDGMLWQAGKGIPAASANFMLEQNEESNYRWVWIDLESGVPAMAPLNPVSFFSFYLPKSVQIKFSSFYFPKSIRIRPLFDDVDIDKLRFYIDANKEDLEGKIGTERYHSILDNIGSLELHQKKWKSIRRAHRSVTYQLKKGNITEDQAKWYFDHPDVWHDFVWYWKEAVSLSRKATRKLMMDLPYNIFNQIISIDYKEAISKAWRFVSSEKYRSELTRDYVRGRIDVWEQRNQLGFEESSHLRSQLETEVTSSYLTDLFIHSSLKIADWSVIPLVGTLYAGGALDLKESSALAIAAGPIMRTLYTGSRMIYNQLRPNNSKKNASRLIALGVGMIPIIGNAAYPVQMVSSGSTKDKDIGKLLLYDIFTRLGQKIPVYGGRDTLTEHFFNHIPDLIVRNRNNINSQSQ